MLVTISNQYWCIIKVYDLSRFPEFLANISSFLFRIPLRAPCCIQFLVSWCSFWSWQRLQKTALIVMTLAALRCVGQVCCEMPLNWNLSDVVSCLYWSDGFLEDRTGQVPFSSHPVKGMWNQHDLTVLDLNHLTEVMLDRFLCWSYSFLHVSILWAFGKEVPVCSQQASRGELRFYPWGQSIYCTYVTWNSAAQICLIYLIINLHQYGLTYSFCNWYYNPIFPYLLCCLYCPNFSPWEFFSWLLWYLTYFDQCDFLKYFFKIFWCGPFLKSLLNLLQYCSWFFSCEACGVLAPRPGIKPAPLAVGGKIWTTRPPEKSPSAWFFLSTPFFSGIARFPRHVLYWYITYSIPRMSHFPQKNSVETKIWHKECSFLLWPLFPGLLTWPNKEIWV